VSPFVPISNQCNKESQLSTGKLEKKSVSAKKSGLLFLHHVRNDKKKKVGMPARGKLAL